jgi:hypothetical protein
MAENFPTEFAEAIELKANLEDRFMWAHDHWGIGKYPVEVDYEEMYDVLMESE